VLVASTLRVLGLMVLHAEPRVMSHTQRLSWGWPLSGDSLFSAELLAAFFCFSGVGRDVVACAHHVTSLLPFSRRISQD
jgi:hypothetical protein